MKKKIILYGHLRDKYPHEIIVEADTVAEALRSLETIEELVPENGLPWPVTVQGIESDIALYSQSNIEELHVYPRTGGAKKGGLLQVILGIVLIALAIWNPAFLGLLGTSSGSLFLSGGLMLLGGILQMLAPTPQGYEESETSKYLGASANTVNIGTRIPLAYGNNRLGGHYLSFDVDSVDWAGEDSSEGVSEVVGSSIFTEYDKTDGMEIVPINPIFTSQTLGPSNVPTSGWIS